MHNSIKSRAIFEIIKKPLPQLMLFYGNMDPSEQSENEDGNGSAVEAEAAGEPAAGASPAGIEPNEVEAAKLAAKEETPVGYAAKLNVNASVFVPRSMNSAPVKVWEKLQLGEPNSNIQTLNVLHKPIQPKLMMPWKGFPKPLPPDRPKKTHAESQELNVADADEESKCSYKKHPNGRPVSKVYVLDEKHREQERKVALEALKLAEQRRMRDAVGQPQTVIHLSRLPVQFTPEERQRVNRLRIIKREHIERVLREMQEDVQLKLQRNGARYISLQSNPQANSYQQRLKAEKPEQPPVASEMPKRFIPTAKQWDERCKALASASVHNENNLADMPLAKPEENCAIEQRAMASSSQDNVMTVSTDNATTTTITTTTTTPTPTPTTTNNPTNTTTTSPLTLASIDSEPLIDGTRELFVPRYWPPAPTDAKVERRRGNITHARDIRGAFSNVGLLPVPGYTEYDLPLPSSKSVKRYNIEELLELEPDPEQLQKPNIPESLSKLLFC